jgi:MFS family permease
LLYPISAFLAFLMIILFVISLSVLLFELTLTRIFSIILWYDYAFMAISVAFFGLGIGALIIHLMKYRLIRSKENLPSKILHCAIAFAISIPVFLFLIGHIIPPSTSFIYLFYLVSSIPFFFAGMSMALIYLAMPGEISKLYFIDLVGAAAATLILDSLMQWLGAESVLLSTAILVIVPTLSAAFVLFFLKWRKRKQSENIPKIIISNTTVFLGIITLAALVGLLALNTTGPSILSIHPGENKGLHQQMMDPSIEHLSTQWNSFSRVDVTRNTKDPRILATIILDADALTPVFRSNGSNTAAVSNQWLKKYMDYMPYEISHANSTLVIGGGGGEDVLVALAGGSKNVTVVEINPLVISAVKRFGGDSGVANLYERKDVKLFIDDGRRFISSTNTKYDRIIIKLVDSWAAQLAGGYALSENYLYTVEGLRQYLRHLDEDNGMLVMVRWNIEMPRLLPLVVESLRKEYPEKNIQDISKQLLVVEDRPGLYFGSNEKRTVYAVLLVIKNKPFADSEINLIKDRIVKRDAKVIAMPGKYVQPPYDRLFLVSGQNYTGRQQQNTQLQNTNSDPINLNMKPPTDDSPFYFAKEPLPKQMLTLLETVLGVSAVLALLLVYYYSRLSRRRKGSDGSSLYPSLGYIIFVICIGLGFMFIEITFIQKFLLLLGTPIMALTVILFSILLSSGIGAYLSGRLFNKSPYKAIVISIPFLAGVLLAYFGYLQTIVDSSITREIHERIVLTFGLLFPAGLLMGFQFPSITKMASYMSSSESNKSSDYDSRNQDITLLWGINIIASVVGTVLAAISSMLIGFRGNLIIGVGLYLLALVSAIMAAKSVMKTDSQSIIK